MTLDSDIDHPEWNANAEGATVIAPRVDMTTAALKQEPDGRLVFEDVDTKASDDAVTVRCHLGCCEVCELPIAARPLLVLHPEPWQAIESGAGMLEAVVAEVPSSLAGGIFRPVWVCSDACERTALMWAGLDPSTAGLR